MHDVIIVGAGPAGSSAAGVLGELGRQVLLVDKASFPRDKTCGDGITFKCLQPLARLGLLEGFHRSAHFCARGFSLWFTDETALTVHRDLEGGAAPVYVLPRHDFDHLLLEGALRHPSVTFLPDTKAQSLVLDGGRATGVVVERHGERVRLTAPLVIDASGVNSHLAVQAGAGNLDPQKCALAIRGYFRNVAGLTDAIELYLARAFLPGYFWIFPTSGSTANVGVGTFQHIVEQNRIELRKLLQDFIDAHPAVKRRLGAAEPCGALSGGKIPLAFDADSSRVRDGLMMIGDAAAFTDPITAEGISYAMRSGIMAAEVAAEALAAGDCSAPGLAAYDRRWRAEFGARFARAAMLTTLLPADTFSTYLTDALHERSAPEGGVEGLGAQYEMMLKLKVLRKVL